MDITCKDVDMDKLCMIPELVGMGVSSNGRYPVGLPF